MTPLYNSLVRLLPAPVARLTLAVIYAALIVMIVTFLIPPGTFEVIYLDLGK